MDEVTNTVAVLVKHLRLERGWTAQRLADECARLGAATLTRGTIAKIESGVRKSVTAEEINILAAALKVPVTLLLAGNRPPSGGLQRDAWRVAIHGSRLGAGVLIADNLVLTAAHVLGQEPPSGAVTVSLPGTSSGATYPAQLVEGGWVPDADLAVLRVDSELPADAQPAELSRTTAPPGSAVRLFGHPRSFAEGIWSRGQVVGTGGPGGERQQLEGMAGPDVRLEPGFSGAGVVDEATGKVVGLLVEASSASAAWMVTVPAVARSWPALDLHLPAPAEAAEPVSELKLPVRVRTRLAEAVQRLEVVRDRGARAMLAAALDPPVSGDVLVRDIRLAAWQLVNAGLSSRTALANFRTALQFFAAPGPQRTAVEALIGDILAGPAGEDEPRSGPAFVVRLQEDALRSDRYLLTIWLAGGGEWECLVASDEPASIDQVRDDVDRQLARLAADGTADIDELTVEFILPRALLDTDVDQWTVSAPGYPSPLGVYFPVVVRDLARIRNQIIRGRWRRHSAWMHEPEDTPAEVRFVSAAESPERVFAELMQDPDHPAGLVVDGSPFRGATDAFGAWMAAGIPVVVWCREPWLAEKFSAAMREHFAAHDARSLPAAVSRLRREAAADPRRDHVGRHITLLWDDASRLPPG